MDDWSSRSVIRTRLNFQQTDRPNTRMSHSSAATASGHVDLDIVKAIVTSTTSLHEIRVAWALTRDPGLQGLRAIERASGLSRETVLKVLPQAGAGTDLLSCTNRGMFAWEAEDRQVMDVQRRVSGADHLCISTYLNSYYVQEVEVDLLEEEDQESIGGRLLTLLDPALDLWSNRVGELGDEGWVLAFLTQGRAATLGLADLATVWRMSERQARRVIERLAGTPWAEKTRVDGRVGLSVDFTYLLTEEGANDFFGRDRQAHKAREHALEAAAVQTMGTELGRTVREMWKNRKAEAAMLRDWAAETGSRAWDNLIWVLENARGRWSGERLIFKDLGPVRA